MFLGLICCYYWEGVYGLSKWRFFFLRVFATNWTKLYSGLSLPTENYEEEIEALLIRKETETEQKVCYALTQACEGVDRSKKPKEKLDFRYNDQPQEMQKEEAPEKPDDGINRINVDINDPKSAERLAEQIKQQLGQQALGGQNEGDDDDDDEDDEDEDDEREGEDDDDDLNEEKDDNDGSKNAKTEL